MKPCKTCGKEALQFGGTEGRMRCCECQRELEVGDRYIEDAPTGYIGKDADPEMDDLLADILGGRGGKLAYCEGCTQEGGDYVLETFWGDDA